MSKFLVGIVIVAALAAAGCSSDKKESAPPATAADSTTTTTVPQPLRVLVTNDDGVAGDGLDALVEQLRTLPNTEVTVIAPATDQTGKGGSVTGGTLTAVDAKTDSGYAAKGVNTTPADSVIWALDQGGIEERPHVVISGINKGQNMGAVIDLSGTIGAARAAATRGVPALAVSQGFGPPEDYPTGVAAALAWLEEHHAELLARDTSSTEAASLTNLNIPTCLTGEVRDVVVVPVDTTDANPLAPSDCETPYENPKSDVDGFAHGYIVQTDNLALTPADG